MTRLQARDRISILGCGDYVPDKSIGGYELLVDISFPVGFG
jgi:hypothetical protein